MCCVHILNEVILTIVYDQWTKDWTPVNAQANMEEALRTTNKQIDAVIAANDATAGGVIQALAAVGLAGQIQLRDKMRIWQECNELLLEHKR